MTRFEKWSVWVTSLLTVLTGAAYFVTKYLLTSQDPYTVINHPLQPYLLKAHILVSPLLLFALGLVAVRHVWRHYRSGVRWSRKSGITAAVSVIPMVATGYLIQVFTHAGWVQAMALSHVGFGFLYGVGVGVHGWVIRLTSPPPANGARLDRSGAESGGTGGERGERAGSGEAEPFQHRSPKIAYGRVSAGEAGGRARREAAGRDAEGGREPR